MTLTLALHTVSEANSHQHWRLRHRRARVQRSTVYYRCRLAWRDVPALPLTITLTRIAPRALDTDNLAASLANCQNGVADFLAGGYGLGQDRQDGLAWIYAQRKGEPYQYAVAIQIEGVPDGL